MSHWHNAHAEVLRACRTTTSSKQLRISVLQAVHRAAPYDAHVWLLCDPVTRVGTSPLATIPGLALADLADLIRLRYLAGEEWTEFHPPGATDVATSIYTDKFGRWGWLDLWRTGGTFTTGERNFLASLEAPVTAALRRSQAETFANVTPNTAADGAAVLILGPDLRPKNQTEAAVRALSELNPAGEDLPLVPAAAYNAAAALLAAEAGRPIGPAWSRVHLGRGTWVTLTATRILESADIAVTIEASTPSQRREIFALAHALTPRERQVLDELATGADTPTIARRLFVSEHTVNDHVKAILAKTDAATRPQLLARIAG